MNGPVYRVLSRSNPQIVILRSVATPVLSQAEGKNPCFSLKRPRFFAPCAAQNDRCVNQGLDISARISDRSAAHIINPLM